MTTRRRFKAIVFDIDGTLTPDISWTALTRDLGTSVEKHLEIFHGHRDGKITYEISKRELLKLWQETGNANKIFFQKLFMGWPLKDGAQELIDYLKSKGYLICLITGAADLYAEVIAKRLGINDFFSNSQFIWDNAGKLKDFHYDIKQDKKKLEQFLEFCREHSLTPRECAVVGDSHNDAELFSVTGNGVAVNSKDSHRLEKIAWKIISNLNEIKELL